MESCYILEIPTAPSYTGVHPRETCFEIPPSFASWKVAEGGFVIKALLFEE